ncbi:MAG: pilus assembly protein PilP [Proteobacteria bacterium]|nr:pilus assembly protein PilP [Pseudomonadota bacterium]MBU1687547.1 pilus assembly protein PilP [Pseudomonadota bacterium]
MNFFKNKAINISGVLLSCCFALTLFTTPLFGQNHAQDELTFEQSEQTVMSEEMSAENIKITRTLAELLKSMNIKAFSYEVEGRPDPFMPFISDRTSPVASETSDTEKLTGMRQYEPGQLSLVAIMLSDDNPMAMVQDSAGKGYVIRRGTKIGRSGIVSDIIGNQVIIKQLTYSMSKERKYKTVEMILRKEGEK